MSQQIVPIQPDIDSEDLQKRRQKFNIIFQDNKDESFRTHYSLEHPGSLDWYILRKFLFLVLASMMFLTSFYIIVDFLTNSDAFIQKCRQYNMSIPVAMFQYYAPKLLSLFDSFLTVFIILPGLLLIAPMIGKEITIFSCMGIRRVRVAYMVFFAAAVMIVLFALCREFVLPAQRFIIGCDINSFFEQNKTRVEPKTDPKTSVYISGESLDLANRTIIKPVFNMPIMLLDTYGQCIYADVAIWMPEERLGNDASSSREAGYLLKNVVAKKCLDDQCSLTLNDKPTLITPLNNKSWIKKGECFLVSGIEIEDLTINAELQEHSTIKELQRIMERMPPYQRNQAAISIHRRITRPFVDCCIIFVGLSFVLANENRIFLIFLRAAIWWLGSWIFINMSIALASDTDKMISPAFAAWAPLIVFSAVSAYVWDRVFY